MCKKSFLVYSKLDLHCRRSHGRAPEIPGAPIGGQEIGEGEEGDTEDTHPEEDEESEVEASENDGIAGGAVCEKKLTREDVHDESGNKSIDKQEQSDPQPSTSKDLAAGETASKRAESPVVVDDEVASGKEYAIEQSEGRRIGGSGGYLHEMEVAAEAPKETPAGCPEELERCEFQMPDNFDLPEDVIMTEERAVGYAASTTPSAGEHSDGELGVGAGMAKVADGATSKCPTSESPEERADRQRNDTADSESIENIIEEMSRLEKAKKPSSSAAPLPRRSASSAEVSKKTERLMSDLFGDEPEESSPPPSKKAEPSPSVTSPPRPSSDRSEPPALQRHTSVMDELAAKRARVLNKIKADRRTGRLEPEVESRVKKRLSREENSRRVRRRRRHTSDKDRKHVCTSACPGDHAMSDDEDWMVPDSECDEDGEWRPKKIRRLSEDSESEDEGNVTGEESTGDKRRQREASKKKRAKAERGRREKYEKELDNLRLSCSESSDGVDEDEHGSGSGRGRKSRKARLLERREKEGLGWMEKGNGRRIVVSEQNTVGEEVLDLRHHLALAKRKQRGGNRSEDEEEETDGGDESATTEDERKARRTRKKRVQQDLSSDFLSSSSSSESTSETDARKDKKRRPPKQPPLLARAKSVSASTSSSSRPRQQRMDKAKDRRWLAYRRSVSEKASKEQERKRSVTFGSSFKDLIPTHSYGLSSEKKPSGTHTAAAGTSGSSSAAAASSSSVASREAIIKGISFKKKPQPPPHPKSSEDNKRDQDGRSGLVVKKRRILSDSE